MFYIMGGNFTKILSLISYNSKNFNGMDTEDHISYDIMSSIMS